MNLHTSIERTYIDKIFAICDYYLSSNLKEHSRHIYDLHKIHPFIKINESFINLIKDVRNTRSNNKMCLSAQSQVNISEVLGEIINTNVYEKDYSEITSDLLFEDVTYKEVIESLKAIVSTGVF